MQDVFSEPARADTPLASDDLFPLVYEELRRLAAGKMAGEKPGQTLDATGLVHEAYLRLTDADQARQWYGRGQFFSAAAEAMRRILVDRARRKASRKRGGGRSRVLLDETRLAVEGPGEILAVDEALEHLAEVDPQAAELVKLRYFAGLSIPDAAQALGIGAEAPIGSGPTPVPGSAARSANPKILARSGPRMR